MSQMSSLRRRVDPISQSMASTFATLEEPEFQRQIRKRETRKRKAANNASKEAPSGGGSSAVSARDEVQ